MNDHARVKFQEKLMGEKKKKLQRKVKEIFSADKIVLKPAQEEDKQI